MLNYKIVSIASAILTSILFLSLLLMPDLIFWIFSIETTEAANFIARRASILFLGLAILSFLSRNTPHSSLRQNIILAMFVLWSLMALLGLFELVRGFAGLGILLAITAEIIFAISYFLIFRKHSNRD